MCLCTTKFYKLLISSILILHSLSIAQGNSLPVFPRLIEPQLHSVYTGNSISFLVDIPDQELDVEAVQYYLRRPFVVMGQEYIRKDILLGEVYIPPYQFIWDCSHFPDMPDLGFYAVVIDKRGDRIQTEIASGIVLDRHKEFRLLKMNAYYVESPLTCDGILQESFWKDVAEPVCFPNGNNRIHFSAGWDRQNLYVGIMVWDTKLYSCYDPNYSSEFLDANPMFKIYYSDFLAVYIDPLNRKTMLRGTMDCEVRISPIGYINWRTTSRRIQSKGVSLGKSRIYGTLNNVNDEDSLWVAELSLPWRIIGIDPEPNYTMGFDIYNVDREDSMLYRLTSLWSGGGAIYVKNPSEWANLTLVPRKSKWSFFPYLASVLIFIFLVTFIIWKKFKGFHFLRNASVIVLSQKEYIVLKINEFLEENFNDDKLDMDKLAKELKFSKEYLMKIYKNGNNKSIHRRLTQIRIEKAKEFIERTTKSLTEIAFEVGFNSSEVFIRNFKRTEGITPSQYKKKIKNSSNYSATKSIKYR